MSKTKNLILIVILVALSSTAIAVASPSGANQSSNSGASAKPATKVDLPRGEVLRHGPVGVRPSTPASLRAKARHQQVKREAAAKSRRQAKQSAAPSGPVGGVSQATLDSIAACESGGDPTAVNAAGYYGKYQFDTGTWASVGGTGNPADASAGEQDYRASLLYQRAGSSPWPVCGQ